MGVNSASFDPILDVEGTLARLGGDRKLFADLVTFVLEDAPPLVAELRDAVAAKDPAAVRNKAHALRGLVAGCGGVRAAQVAQSLENAGQKSDLTQAASLVESLRTELELLTRALRAHVA